MKFTQFSLPLALVLAAVVSASPAEAQKGRGNGNGQGQSQQDRNRDRERDDDRDRDRDDDDDRYDDRRDRDDRRNREEPRFERRRNVPRGWCEGRGNPHNTVENCGPGAGRTSSSRAPSGDRRYSNGGSFDQAHRDFHYSHDRQCRERVAQNPTSIRWQLQVRSECKARHDDFHRQWGISHR